MERLERRSTTMEHQRHADRPSCALLLARANVLPRGWQFDGHYRLRGDDVSRECGLVQVFHLERGIHGASLQFAQPGSLDRKVRV